MQGYVATEWILSLYEVQHISMHVRTKQTAKSIDPKGSLTFKINYAISVLVP